MPKVSSKPPSPVNLVHYYYDHIDGLPGHGNDRELISLCRNSWERNGWCVKELNESVAQRHPSFRELQLNTRTFPTVNPQRYELACYYRWCALAQMGGGLIIDYDMINYGFAPSDIEDWSQSYWMDLEGVHPPIFLTKRDSESFVTLFCTWDRNRVRTEVGKPHLSDMHILDIVRFPQFKRIPISMSWHQGNSWESSKVVHFCSTSAMGDKSEIVRKVNEMKGLKIL